MHRLIIIFLIIFCNTWAQPELHQYSYGGFEREYYLYVPESIQSEAPLVFVFHGYTGSAAGIMDYSGFNAIADENGFAVCYPQGLTDNYGNTFFNVGYSFHWNETVDDVGFAISLASYLQSHYDLSHINTFSTGMSNGGDLSYLLACDASTTFRAVGPVAGIMMEWIYDSCDPENPMPILEIHGTNDNISWWDGDLEDEDGWGPYIGVDIAIQFWSEENNCTVTVLDTLADINTSDGSYVVSENYQSLSNNNEVWLYKVINGGHDWPGVWGNMDINASELVWSFFNDFSLVYHIGDIDYNGSVDIGDILLLSDEIFLNINYNFLSDLNNDNTVDINDIFAILALVLGI